MQSHAAANLFPMDESTIEELAEDIAKHGQQQDIEIYQGMILDGRRRWKACRLAGVTPRTREVNPVDPIAYVLSLNLHRRQLTPSQRAMVAARARDYYDREAKARQLAAQNNDAGRAVGANLPQQNSRARDAAGKAVGIGGKSVDYATKVLTKGVPELVAAVEEGRMAVSTAAVLTAEPAEEQRTQAVKATRTYAPKPPAAKKPEAKMHVVVNGEVYDGLRYADMAIAQLKRIKEEDPTRDEALRRVGKWINQNS